jgi:hypothetical protein
MTVYLGTHLIVWALVRGEGRHNTHIDFGASRGARVVEFDIVPPRRRPQKTAEVRERGAKFQMLWSNHSSK